MLKKKKEKNTKQNKKGFENYWSKNAFLFTKSNNRNLEFYVFNYRRNLKLSLYITLFCLFLFFINVFILYKKIHENKLIFTSINGSVYDFKLNQEKADALKKALTELRNPEKTNAPNKANQTPAENLNK